MRKLALTCVFVVLAVLPLLAQFTGDVLGSHDLSPGGTSPIKGGMTAPCQYCHAPHSGIGGNTPLWSQTLSTQTYTLYGSTTEQNLSTQPAMGGSSSLCLSCHDGTIAPGQAVPYGKITMTGSMYSNDVFGTALVSSHPFSLKTPLVDSPDLVPSLATTKTTADASGAVQLINGNVECTSCHNPHVQGIDKLSFNFLVRDSSNGELCLACHATNSRTVNGKSNPLVQWPNSIHAVSAAVVNPTANMGSYTTVAQFACLSCHMPHNAGGDAGLLRGATTPPPNMDAATQSCMVCHDGTNLQQPIANVYAEFAKAGHPFPAGSNTHDANEPALLVNNRHATCVDCHDAHASLQTGSFTPPPGLRPAQNGAVGISDTDGTTVLDPAVNQYETCLRCHGTSPGKQTLAIYGYTPARAVSAADPLDVIPQFAATATSSHPVTHDANSIYSQPSLRAYMLNLDGITNSQRTLGAGPGSRIFCSDCHNSDDDREFGGSGPNGPHGSKWTHILERRYEMSQAPTPGALMTNTYPNPDLSVNGPYALCAKCHDLNVVLSPTSVFTRHYSHVVTDGASCSVCHTAHGMGATSGSISGQRLVNFDVNVVAPVDNSTPITYDMASRSCTLTCHNHVHKGAQY